jgi:hypothetical protein
MGVFEDPQDADDTTASDPLDAAETTASDPFDAAESALADSLGVVERAHFELGRALYPEDDDLVARKQLVEKSPFEILGEEPQKFPSAGKWSVAVEKAWFPCFGSITNFQIHDSEQDARNAFHSLKGARILIDESGAEVLAAAPPLMKTYSLRMVREKLKRSVLFGPPPAVEQGKEEPLGMSPPFEFPDENDIHCEDFTARPNAVELPKKRLASDTVSTHCDELSSRTTRSVRSKDSRRTMDICQSTSSSVYRLLDLDSINGSRAGSVFEDRSIKHSELGEMD